MRTVPNILLVMIMNSFLATSSAQSDLCTGAILVGCGSVTNGSTAAFTVDAAPFCGTGNGTAGGVWYRFIGNGGPVVASLCGSTYDTKLRIYTGTCAALVCEVGDDDDCGLQSQVNWTSTNGTTYYILVHGYGGASGNYTLTITCPPPPTPLCYSTTTTPYLADPYAGNQLTLTDDVHSGVVPIGFDFCYNGTTYNQCVISSNNYVSFDPTVAGTYSPWVTVAVPNLAPDEVHNSIMNPWQDIHPGIGGQISYQTLGVAPNRRFVVGYLNIPMFSCTSQLYTSQTVLYEGSNCIASYITTKPICTTWNSGNAVHGLQNSGGTSATVIAGRNNTQWSATAQGRFFTPTCAPCQTAQSLNCLAVVLPIELLYLKGKNEGEINVLNWATASEQDNSHFVVERSNDGESFQPISIVPGAGNSQQTIEYEFRDNIPLTGTNYYRLQSVDTDGESKLSEIIAVETGSAEILVYPNPVQDNIGLELPASVELPVQVEIRDVRGQIVLSRSVNDLRSAINSSDLVNGIYFIELPELGSNVTQLFVVSR